MNINKATSQADNLYESYPAFWKGSRKSKQKRFEVRAVFYGVGLACSLTLASLLLGILWSQAVQKVALNYSLLVDLILGGSLVFGAYKGAQRARGFGLMHGALIGLAYSAVGIVLIAIFLPINWLGAVQTAGIALLVGSVGGAAGFSVKSEKPGNYAKSAIYESLSKPLTTTDSKESSRNLYEEYFSKR